MKGKKIQFQDRRTRKYTDEYHSNYEYPKRGNLRIITVFILMSLVITIFLTVSAAAQESGGPKTVSGQVYKSNGDPVESKYNGAHVELHIIHDGHESPVLDLNGLENGWYSVTIETGEWSQGDIYWIVVKGEQWGDRNGRAEEKNVSGVNEWRMVGPGSHQLDIKTVEESVEIDSSVINLEPEIAFISGIIILIVGLYLVGPKKKTGVDVIVISRRLPPEHSAKSSGNNNPKDYVYEFGYGDPSAPIPIGRLDDIDERLAESSVVRVRVRGIVGAPDGNYRWYKPELVGLEKADESPLLAPDNVSDLDRLWYANGSIKMERGQKPSSAVNQRFMKNFAALILPFVLLEFIIGIYSYIYEVLIIPPFIGEALFVNVIILILGIIGPLIITGIGTRTKSQVEQLKRKHYTIRQWAIFQPESKDAGNIQKGRRVDICSNCKTRVPQTSLSCPSCERNFVSSIEITPQEAKKLLEKSPARGTFQVTSATSNGTDSAVPQAAPGGTEQKEGETAQLTGTQPQLKKPSLPPKT
jgi:hypothetical protein